MEGLQSDAEIDAQYTDNIKAVDQYLGVKGKKSPPSHQSSRRGAAAHRALSQNLFTESANIQKTQRVDVLPPTVRDHGGPHAPEPRAPDPQPVHRHVEHRRGRLEMGRVRHTRETDGRLPPQLRPGRQPRRHAFPLRVHRRLSPRHDQRGQGKGNEHTTCRSVYGGSGGPEGSLGVSWLDG